MKLLYTISIYLYLLGIQLAQVVLPKARTWVNGRKNWLPQLQAKLAAQRKPGQSLIWIHCASLGEFEQGRPLIEGLKQRYPDRLILLSFYSPSGYEIRKNYSLADIVCYLPADTPRNARQFLDCVKPDLIVFVKYEFWFNLLYNIRLRNIPTVLISARFRPGQVFFQWYGGWFRQQLRAFQYIFMQDQAHTTLLDKYQMPYAVVGDTRVDRVAALASEQRTTPEIDAFCAGGPVLVAGSTWLPDEQLLATLVAQKAFDNWKLILAPHDIQSKHLEEIERIFPDSVRYSALAENQSVPSKILIIDNIGMLSGLYAHAQIAWIGGAFGSGLHNTLEPIAFGCPVLFGPRYSKFVEAVVLLQTGGAQTVSNPHELLAAWKKWQDPTALQEASRAARAYIHQNQGATQHILQWLERNWA